MAQSGSLEEQLNQMNIIGDSASAETPESARFRSLPQTMQQQLLLEYPRILATAMHQYSGGEDCESILKQMFENCSEMLRVRNNDGHNSMANALLMGQEDRAETLVDLAARRNPTSLDDRTRHNETLLMLSTTCGSAANLMNRLLMMEPTQLHRFYDIDGRNFLHHCAMEESIDALDAALRLTKTLIQDGRLDVEQVSAAIHMNDRSGDALMHMMASRNRRDMLQLLVQFANEAGISINIDDRQHRDNRLTPLMVAAIAGAVEAAEFLLDNGADPYEEDRNGRTAIDMAAGNPQLMKLFQGDTEDHVMMDANDADEVEGSWLTSGQPVRSVDSGIDSIGAGSCNRGIVTYASASSLANCSSSFGMQSPLQSSVLSTADTQLSSDDLEKLEVKLRYSGKSEAFLQALTRQDPTFKLDSIVQLSEKPICTAFSLWTARGSHVPLRSLVLEALAEVEECEI